MNDPTMGANDLVQSRRFGQGSIVAVLGATTVVRFAHGIEECATADLVPLRSISKKVATGETDEPARVVARVLAEAINAVNAQWGVFSTSRIELLPHQLWVCRKVLERLPARWLVADDVGLGKTIEAGLVLWPLLAKGRVRRLLIICPASLCEQWQYRLQSMFDIRARIFATENDQGRVNFWEGSPLQVIVSLQTIRGVSSETASKRQARLLQSPKWDLVIVDEAHHLNDDEGTGPTLGSRLIRALTHGGKVDSMLFFTATPHRGKTLGFLSLLNLLRPDLVPDAKRPMEDYIQVLPQVMIRNNKQAVTDLEGKRLFQAPVVRQETYSYSPEEAEFYRLMTEFIASGRAYASGLQQRDAQAVTLVLIAMQKLAASSVAAIRRALEGRMARLQESTGRARRRLEIQQAFDALDDEAAQLEETRVEQLDLQLVDDELVHLEHLLRAARAVTEETKIRRILELTQTVFAERSVLFFTEYKATQSLLMSALIARHGADAVSFINGDGEARDVVINGQARQVRTGRAQAAERFNEGKVRFLVSTEAAGEGIDLQGSCHSLVHVDLPWNPMRMHQRVGRLNRYGQKKRVEVAILRNPETVEAQIWEKLDIKIREIVKAFAGVMDEPEDLANLVLGMTPGAVFDDLFFQSAGRPGAETWVEKQTARLDPKEAIAMVQQLFGSCARFDFKHDAAAIPRVDLDALQPFLELALALEGRRLTRTPDGRYNIQTPEGWRGGAELVLDRYQGVTFDRAAKGGAEKVLGAGHRLVERALTEMAGSTTSVALLPGKGLPGIVVVRLLDRITSTDSTVRSAIVGLTYNPRSGEHDTWLRDWQLVKLLNEHVPSLTKSVQANLDRAVIDKCLASVSQRALALIHKLDLPFSMPDAEALAVLWPVP